MKWAFIDYENIGSLNKVDLSCYEKIIIFVGATQKTINFGDYVYLEPLEITYIKIAEVKKNNLDLHLAYYLSHYNNIASNSSSANYGSSKNGSSTNIAFEVISNDKAFAPLVTHINSTGRQCTQVGWLAEASNKLKNTRIKKAKKNTPHLISNIYYMHKAARPKRISALRNHIQTCMGIKDNVQLEVHKYIKELLQEGVISIENELVKYNR